LHISKIHFLFLVSFTIEWKVSIAEFYLYRYMGFGADLLKKTAEIGIRTPLKSTNYFRFLWQTQQRVDGIKLLLGM